MHCRHTSTYEYMLYMYSVQCDTLYITGTVQKHREGLRPGPRDGNGGQNAAQTFHPRLPPQVHMKGPTEAQPARNSYPSEMSPTVLRLSFAGLESVDVPDNPAATVELHAAGNRIRVLSPWIRSFSCLRRLDIRHNALESCAGVSACTQVRQPRTSMPPHLSVPHTKYPVTGLPPARRARPPGQ